MKPDKKIDYQKLISQLSNQRDTPAEEMDLATAHAILKRAGVEIKNLGPELRRRLEKEAEEMISRGEEVPENIRKLLKTL